MEGVFKNLKIGSKLAAGFTVLLAIFATAGGLSWRSMNEVIDEIGALERRYIPSVHMVNEVENLGQEVMLNIRTYVLGESFADLDAAKENFQELMEVIGKAKAHGASYDGLERLVEGMDRAERQAVVYQGLLEDSQALIANMSTQRRQAAEAAASMGTIAYDLLFDEKDDLEDGIKNWASRGELAEMQDRIALLEELIETVHKAESLTLRAIAERRMGLLDQVEQELVHIRKLLKEIDDSSDGGHSDRIKRALGDAESYSRAIINLKDASSRLDEMGQARTAAGSALVAAADDVMRFTVEQALSIAQLVSGNAKAVSRTLLMSVLFALFAGAVIAGLITRVITGPIKRAVQIADRAGKGDLSVERWEFGHDGSDEMGALADALALMVKNQADSVKEVVDAAQDIMGGAETLAALSEETNASVEEVRSSLDQVASISENNSASLEESNAGIAQVAEGAYGTAKASSEGVSVTRHTASVAKEAVDSVEDVIEDVQSVGRSSEESLEKIRALASSVEDISRFVSVITSIADQTNLLALNAAIEAARAGDAGRGFAVVADEVRKLAEESNRAAKEVDRIITTLGENAQESITVTERTGKVMSQAASKADRVRTQLADVLKEIGRITQVVSDLASVADNQASSTKEMAQAIDQISQANMDVVQRVETIRRASGEMAGASEGVACQAAEMAERAQSMRALLDRFTLSKSERGVSPVEKD